MDETVVTRLSNACDAVRTTECSGLAAVASATALAPPWLPDSAAIAAAAGLPPARVAVVEAIGSTNQALMSAPWAPDPAEPMLLLARRQIDGRGRRGRRWHSGEAGSLTFSVALELPLALAGPRLIGLPVVAGLAIAEHLAGLGVGISLKWPNDLQRDGCKIAGLLFESRVHGERIRVVGGLGLNLLPESGVRAAVGQPTATLVDRPEQLPTRDSLAGRLAALLIASVRGEMAMDLPARWARFDRLAGRQVDIVFDGRILHSGVAAGIHPDGALRLRQACRDLRVDVGEVSVRLEGAPPPENPMVRDAGRQAAPPGREIGPESRQ